MRKPLVKVCGITKFDDASFAYDNGADIIGLVLTSSSPRRADPKLVHDLSESGISVAGVYCSISEIGEESCDLDYVQLHFDHDEGIAKIVRASSGGRIISVVSGSRPDFNEIVALKLAQGSDLVLAEFKDGAINHITEIADMENISSLGVAGHICNQDAEMFARTGIALIDSSSSLEISPGIKSRRQVLDYIRAVKG